MDFNFLLAKKRRTTRTHNEWADENCALYLNVFRLTEHDRWGTRYCSMKSHCYTFSSKWNINAALVLHIRISDSRRTHFNVFEPNIVAINLFHILTSRCVCNYGTLRMVLFLALASHLYHAIITTTAVSTFLSLPSVAEWIDESPSRYVLNLRLMSVCLGLIYNYMYLNK